MRIFKSTVCDAGESECWTAVLDFLMLRCRPGCIFSAEADRNQGGALQAMAGRKVRSAVAPSGAGSSTLSSAAVISQALCVLRSGL